jgi:hypothetical protein
MAAKEYDPDVLGDALSKISGGLTYAETAVRTGAPYWMISGNIRKIPVPMLLDEKDKIEAQAERSGITSPEVIMEMVNYFWDDYIKLKHNRKKKK